MHTVARHGAKRQHGRIIVLHAHFIEPKQSLVVSEHCFFVAARVNCDPLESMLPYEQISFLFTVLAAKRIDPRLGIESTRILITYICQILIGHLASEVGALTAIHYTDLNASLLHLFLHKVDGERLN